MHLSKALNLHLSGLGLQVALSASALSVILCRTDRSQDTSSCFIKSNLFYSRCSPSCWVCPPSPITGPGTQCGTSCWTPAPPPPSPGVTGPSSWSAQHCWPGHCSHCDWLRPITWLECWPLIGWGWSCDLDTILWLVEADRVTWIQASDWPAMPRLVIIMVVKKITKWKVSCETKYNGSETKQWNLLWNKLESWNRTKLFYSKCWLMTTKWCVVKRRLSFWKSLNENKWPVCWVEYFYLVYLFQFCCCSQILRLWKRTCQWINRLREFFLRHKTKAMELNQAF